MAHMLVAKGWNLRVVLSSKDRTLGGFVVSSYIISS